MLEKGFHIGKYEVKKLLGSGGMGEVYLAHDVQLNRLVALKILSKEFSSDELRRHRFKQEARAASALNHPNLVTIYEIGESDEGWFIAHEYVEGETLRQYLRDSPLTTLKAVRFAEQIAQALVAAHEAKIIHRDIKPENIMIRRDGYVKVLDFGLAKQTDPLNDPDNPTAQIFNTQPGMVMGSTRYMSPEQARGLVVDNRTDIWSLGVVLYEMITGTKPFHGNTPTDTLAAVIHLEPLPLTHFAPNAPAELQRIVRTALKKEREERYQSIKDFALDLKKLLYDLEHEISIENHLLARANSDIGENPTILHQSFNSGQNTSGINPQTQMSVVPTSSAEYVVTQIKSHKWQSALGTIGILAVITGCIFAYRFLFGEKHMMSATAFEKTQVSRLESDGKVRLTTISPNGKYVTYASGDLGSRSLVVRQISTDSIVTIVPPTSLDFNAVSFSPDGDYIYYTQISKDSSINTLYRIPTLGGTSKLLIEDVDSPVTFAPDGKRMAFIRHASSKNTDTIFIANADGSNLQPLVATDQTEFSSFVGPIWSPDGTKFLIGAQKTQGGADGGWLIAQVTISDRTVKAFSDRKWGNLDSYCWLKDGSGFLVAGRESEQSFTQIWRVSYPGGEIKAITNDSNNYFGLGVSDDANTVITIKGDVSYGLWSFNPASKEMKQLMPERRGLFWDTRLSQMPDGRLLFSHRENNQTNIWSVNATGTNEQQVIGEAKATSNPVASPDGRFFVFASNRSGNSRIWKADSDGKNLIQLSDADTNQEHYNPQVTADGKTVIFQKADSNGNKSSIAKVSIDGGIVEPVLDEAENTNMGPRLSPDGKYITFIHLDLKTFNRRWYIASLDGTSIKQIEKDWEYSLIDNYSWSPDSQSLTYLSRDGVPNLWKRSLNENSKPEPLTEFKTGRIYNFAWSRDGKEIFIVRGLVNNDLVLIKDIIK